jgi:hypothetical protein
MTSASPPRYSVSVSSERPELAAVQKMHEGVWSGLGPVKYGYLQGVKRISMNFEFRMANFE